MVVAIHNKRVNLLFLVFSVVIFLSSFLLFQVQPLISKHILPWFGGGSSVWLTAMFFFMLVLAGGYVYALFLSFCSRRLQLGLHVTLMAGAAILIFSHAHSWPSAITPAFADITYATTDPTLKVFWVLLASVGGPFLLLSTTSTLLQLWYGKLSGKEPFSLYAVSNVGSLLGLLSYPLLFEPFFSTDAQGRWWTWGMVVYLVLLAGVMLHYFRTSSNEPVAQEFSLRTVSVRYFLRWVWLAGVPVATLLTGTDYLSTHVASVPLMWVAPLALYLISFIVSFQGGQWVRPMTVHIFMLVFVGMAFLTVLFFNTVVPVFFSVGIILASMFCVFHFCHEALYAARPEVHRLSLFYMALSIGGVLGSVGVILSTLYLLKMPIEFVVILLAVLLILGNQWLRQYASERLPVWISTHRREFALSITGCVIVAFGLYLSHSVNGVVSQSRNFYGYKVVKERTLNGGSVRSLIHGLTIHGIQVQFGEFQGQPAAYYGPGSGIGKTFSYLRQLQGQRGLRVAVLGLGGGGLAAYCQTEDHFQFFEIDPQVIDMAHEQFSYLQHCRDKEVILGDARINLAEKNRGNTVPYDLIIVDTYADDIAPIHMLTTEAAELYRSLLAPEGMLAIHISSRYLNLLPVVASYAQKVSLTGRFVSDQTTVTFPYFRSLWTLFARDPLVFEAPSLVGLTTFEHIQPREWTDTYSSLLPIIKVSAFPLVQIDQK